MKEAAHARLRFSLSLHRMRGEGWGEGFRAAAVVAAPLIRPSATFSPRCAKGEGSPRESRCDCAGLHSSLSQRTQAGVRENGYEVSVAATGLKARYMTAWGGASSASEAPGSPDTTTPALKGRHSVTPLQGVLSTGPATWAFGALRALQPRLLYGGLSALSCQVAASLSVCIHSHSRDSRANSSLT